MRMSDPDIDNKNTVKTEPASQGLKFVLESGPVIIFVVLYLYMRRSNPDGAIYPAAAVFTILSIMALAISRIKFGKFSFPLVLGTVVITVSVGLAYIFRNPTFFYMKPTVINALFGAAVIGGVFARKNVIKMLMGEAFSLPDKAWNTLAIRWGLFFFALAIVNEIVWRGFDEAFWVKFKIFGFMPLTIAFTLLQMPFILKHSSKTPPQT